MYSERNTQHVNANWTWNLQEMRFSGSGWIKVENEKHGSGWNGEREKEDEKKKNERDWNLQRVTSLLLVWLGGGIAGCGDGCELKSSKFIICKQISSTSLLISAITSLHRNLVPVTEKNIHHRPRWTSNSAKTGRLFSSYWHKLIKRYESRKNSKSFESRINAALTQARHVDTRVRLDDSPFRENTETLARGATNIDFQVLQPRKLY